MISQKKKKLNTSPNYFNFFSDTEFNSSVSFSVFWGNWRLIRIRHSSGAGEMQYLRMHAQFVCATCLYCLQMDFPQINAITNICVWIMREGEIDIRLEFTMALHCVRNVIAMCSPILVRIVYVGVAFVMSKCKMKIRLTLPFWIFTFFPCTPTNTIETTTTGKEAAVGDRIPFRISQIVLTRKRIMQLISMMCAFHEMTNNLNFY